MGVHFIRKLTRTRRVDYQGLAADRGHPSRLGMSKSRQVLRGGEGVLAMSTHRPVQEKRKEDSSQRGYRERPKRTVIFRERTLSLKKKRVLYQGER